MKPNLPLPLMAALIALAAAADAGAAPSAFQDFTPLAASVPGWLAPGISSRSIVVSLIPTADPVG